MAAGRGKCVEIFHVIGDTLCQLGKPPLRPDLGPPYVESSADTSENSESDRQQTNVDQVEVLPDELDRLDIDESEIVMDETDILEVQVSMTVFTYV